MPWAPLPSPNPHVTFRFQPLAPVSQQPPCCSLRAPSPAERSGGGLRSVDSQPTGCPPAQRLWRPKSVCLPASGFLPCGRAPLTPRMKLFAAGHSGSPPNASAISPCSLCEPHAGRTNRIHSQNDTEHTTHRRGNHFHLIGKDHQPPGVLVTPFSSGRQNSRREIREPQMQLFTQCTAYSEELPHPSMSRKGKYVFVSKGEKLLIFLLLVFPQDSDKRSKKKKRDNKCKIKKENLSSMKLVFIFTSK